MQRFTLVDARPGDAAGNPAAAPQQPAGSGVGRNGVGGSGGPLVSGVSSYELEGSVAELGSHVNQQVRITGRMDPRETLAEARGGSTGTRTATGTSGSGTAASSARDNGPAGAGTSVESGGRHVVVDSVQMMAASCTASH